MNEQCTPIMPLWDVVDLAAYIHKSTRTVYRLVHMGELPQPMNIRGRGWLWHPSVIERWAKRVPSYFYDAMGRVNSTWFRGYKPGRVQLAKVDWDSSPKWVRWLWPAGVTFTFRVLASDGKEIMYHPAGRTRFYSNEQLYGSTDFKVQLFGRVK